MSGKLVKLLGAGNAVLAMLAILVAWGPALAAEQDADKGCWRQRTIMWEEEYCCSWLDCNCNIFEFGECTV